MIELSKEKILESIQNEPEAWANLLLVQAKLIAEYERQLDDCRARMEYLLKDPEEQEH